MCACHFTIFIDFLFFYAIIIVILYICYKHLLVITTRDLRDPAIMLKGNTV